MARKFSYDWDALKNKIETENNSKRKSYKDDRMFKPDWKRCAEESKFYVLRFLPDEEGTPFVKYYSHSFKYKKGTEQKWYINNCMTTFGWDVGCPVCDKNREYYDSPYDSDKEIAGQRKRKLNYVSNVLVVKDPFEPENNGKVMLYRFGSKIYEKIEKLLFPSEADLEDEDFVQFVPFDLYEGANFKLKVKMQQKFPNYDDSEFAKQSPVGKEQEIDEIMSKTHKLDEFTDQSKYPTREKVIEQIGFLLGEEIAADEDVPTDSDDDDVPVDNGADDNYSGDAAYTDEPTSDEDSASADEPTSDAELSADEAFFKNMK